MELELMVYRDDDLHDDERKRSFSTQYNWPLSSKEVVDSYLTDYDPVYLDKETTLVEKIKAFFKKCVTTIWVTSTNKRQNENVINNL